MKLLRYGDPGFEKPGCLDESGKIRDLSQFIPDIGNHILSPTSLDNLKKIRINNLPIVSGNPRIGPCVNHVGKFLCIGLNYADHAAETGSKIPPEPVLFSKATSCIAGPFDDIVIPKNSQHTDWEVELGLVIGTRGKYIPESQAINHIAGFCVVNDVSERRFQLHGTGQWIKGKSCDSFGPIGPWLVTVDELPNYQSLSLYLEVDNKRYQDSNTAKMIFSIEFLVSYVSQFFTLHPGDIISTGTPAGVGMAQKPHSIFLKPGQTVKLGVQGLGEQVHKTVLEK